MPQAPEIFKYSLDSLTIEGLPERNSPDFENAVFQNLTLNYAAKGYTAAVVIQDGYVIGVAVPQEGIEPKKYVLGLLEHGFLEDALPALEILAEMFKDPEILYNYGLCLSELDRVKESVAPLKECTELEPNYPNAYAALGFSYIKLGELEEAEQTLSNATKKLPDDPWINRNLAGLLAKRGKHDEAKPVFERALAANPKDAGLLYGAALNLEELGPENYEQAIKLYQEVIELEANSSLAEQAKKSVSRLAQKNMKSRVGGGLRMDAVMYMQSAFEAFDKMKPQQVAETVFEIARIGEGGLSINDPSKRYQLKSLEGDFSGLQLLSMMHVGLKQIDPSVDSQSGLDAEYDAAKKMAGK